MPTHSTPVASAIAVHRTSLSSVSIELFRNLFWTPLRVLRSLRFSLVETQRQTVVALLMLGEGEKESRSYSTAITKHQREPVVKPACDYPGQYRRLKTTWSSASKKRLSGPLPVRGATAAIRSVDVSAISKCSPAVMLRTSNSFAGFERVKVSGTETAATPSESCSVVV